MATLGRGIARQIEIPIRADASQFRRTLGSIRADAQAGADIEVGVDTGHALVDVESLLARIRGIRDQIIELDLNDRRVRTRLAVIRGELIELGNHLVNIPVDLQDARARRAIEGLRAALASVNDLDVATHVDTAGSQAALRRLASSLHEVGRIHETATADVNTGRAAAKVEGLEGLLGRFGAMRESATADVNTGEASLKVRTLSALVRRVSGQRLDITADADTGRAQLALAALNNRINGTNSALGRTASSGLRRFGVLAGAIFAVVAAGAAPATAALAGLGAAITGLVTGFGLLALAAGPTILALAGKTDGLTSSQQALKDSLAGLKEQYLSTFFAANDAFNMLVIQIIGLAERAMPALAAASLATVGAVADAFDRLTREWGGGRQQNLFSQFLARSSRLTGTFVEILGRLGTALLNVFTAALPFVQRFFGWLDAVVKRFLDWTQSAEGQSAITRFFEQMAPVLTALKDAFVALAVGLFNLSRHPAMRQLLINLSELLEVVGRNLPALSRLIALLNPLLGAFNRLPPRVQDTVVQLAALGLIFKLFAGGLITGVIGGLVGIVAQMFFFSRVVRAVNPEVRLFGNILGRLGAIARGAARAIGGAFRGLGRLVASALRGVASAASRALSGLGRAVARPFQALGRIIARSLSGLARVVGRAFSAVVQAASRALAPIGRVVSRALGSIRTIFSRSLSGLGRIVSRALGGIRSIFARSLSGLGRIVSRALGGIRSIFSRSLSGLGRIVSRALGGIRTIFSRSLSGLGRIVSRALGSIRSIFARSLSGLGRIVARALGGIRTIFARSLSGLGRIVSRALGGIRTIFARSLSGLGRIVSRALGGIRSIFARSLSGLGRIVSRVLGGIRTIFARSLSGIGRIVARALGGVRTIFSRSLSGLGRIVARALGGIRSIFTRSLSGLGRIVARAFSGFGRIIARAMGPIAGIVRRVFGAALPRIIGGFGRWFAGTFVRRMIGGALFGPEGMVIQFGTIPIAILSRIRPLQRILKLVPDWLQQYFVAIPGVIFLNASEHWQRDMRVLGNIVSTGGRLIVGAFKALSGWADQALHGISNWLVNVWQGITQGVQRAAERFWAWLKELGQRALDYIRSLYGIRSPSRVMQQIGRYIAEGLALGIREGIGRVDAAARAMADAAGKDTTVTADVGVRTRRAEDVALSVPLRLDTPARTATSHAREIVRMALAGQQSGSHRQPITIHSHLYIRGRQFAQEVIEVIEDSTRESRRQGSYPGLGI